MDGAIAAAERPPLSTEASHSITLPHRRCATTSSGLSEFTEPMRALITECARRVPVKGRSGSSARRSHSSTDSRSPSVMSISSRPVSRKPMARSPETHVSTTSPTAWMSILQQTGCSAVPWGLSSLSRSRSRSGSRPWSPSLAGPCRAPCSGSRCRAGPGAEAELTLAEGQRSRQRDVLVIEVEHRLPDLDPPP